MNDDRLNLDPLDPAHDDSFADRVASIAVAAMAARRAAAAPPPRPAIVRELGAWLHPVLVGAGLVAAASIGAIVIEGLHRDVIPPPPRGAPAVAILGIPAPLIELARSTTDPSVSQLVAALGVPKEGDVRGR